jgi:hypothetical protein
MNGVSHSDTIEPAASIAMRPADSVVSQPLGAAGSAS